VSFDNVAVGTAQGEGIIECLGGPEAADGARIIQLHGSPTDNNATLFREGYQAAIADSGIETVGEEAVPDWDNAQAAVIFEQLLTAAGGDIDGVLVANDGLSLAAQQVLADAGLTLPTTGQDATPEGLRAILEGTQCMTVYKPVAEEANAAVAAAAALLNGEEIDTSVTIDNEVAEIPYVQAEIQSIFISDVHILVDDGFVAYADVCDGIEDLCTENGIVDPGGEAMVETTVAEAMVEARAGLSTQLEAFAANTMEYMKRERALLLDGVGVPEIKTPIEGKHVLIVVRGYDYKEDLVALRPYIREYRPVLIGVDGGADALEQPVERQVPCLRQRPPETLGGNMAPLPRPLRIARDETDDLRGRASHDLRDHRCEVTREITPPPLLPGRDNQPRTLVVDDRGPRSLEAEATPAALGTPQDGPGSGAATSRTDGWNDADQELAAEATEGRAREVAARTAGGQHNAERRHAPTVWAKA